MDEAGNLAHASKGSTTTANQSISQAPINSLPVQIKAASKRRIRDKEPNDLKKAPAMPEDAKWKFSG